MLLGLEPLHGCKLQRLDSPAPDVLTWVWTRPGQRQVLIARLRGSPLGVGLLAERPKGDAASGAITKLRHHLHGAVLTDASFTPERHLQLTLQRGPRRLLLELSFAEGAGNCRLLTESGQPLTQLHRGPGPQRSQKIALEVEQAALQALGQRLLTGDAQPRSDPERSALLQAIDRRERSLQRRLGAIKADAARAAQSPRLRGLANGVMAALHAPQILERRLHVIDYSADPPSAQWLSLAAGETPVQLAERLFQQARRFERGARIAAERESATRREMEALSELRQTVVRQVKRDDLSALREAARALGCRGLSGDSPHPTGGQPARRLPYREFRSAEGLPILVGRSARDNDQLTLHYASPQDLFLHARGCKGAHVIVPLNRGQACPPETLLDAAMLAVHFSKGHGEAQADVSYAEKRYVRKAKGSPAGQVLMQQERVLPMRMDTARLRQVLATELAH